MSLRRRDIVLALAAIAGGAGGQAAAQATIDLSMGRAIGAAYRAANPDANLSRLRLELQHGFTPDRAPHLRERAAADFRAARVFIFKGWRLSETEAQLFALLTSAS